MKDGQMIRCTTVGELREAIEGVDDSTPVIVERGDWSATDESPNVGVEGGVLVIEHPFS